MGVRLHLRLIRVLAVLVDTPSRFEVEVASTRSWSRCLFCGFKCRAVHDRRRRKIRDLPVSGRRVTLVWIRRRFVCSNCDVRHLEDHGVVRGRSDPGGWLASSSLMPRSCRFDAVVRRHGLNWHLIQDLVTSWSALVAEQRRSCRCRVVLVDETSMRKRHPLCDGDRHRRPPARSWPWSSIATLLRWPGFHRTRATLVPEPSRWSSLTGRSPTRQPSTPISVTPAMYWTGSMLLDSSPKASPWCAEICNAANRPGSKPAFDPGPVQSPLRSATTSRPPQQTRPDPPRPALRHPPKTASRQRCPPRTSTGLYQADDHDGALEALDRFTDLYATGQLGEFHHAIVRHHHCRGRPDLGLARKRPALQRPNRRNQQPPPNPTAASPTASPTPTTTPPAHSSRHDHPTETSGLTSHRFVAGPTFAVLRLAPHD